MPKQIRAFLEQYATIWPVLALGALVFLPSIGYEMSQLDDPKHIFENPLLNPVTANNIVHFWTTPFFSLYIPVIYSTWSAVALASHALLGSVSPAAFHLLNILFHLLNVFLLFKLLNHFIDCNRAVGFGVLLFCIHPFQVESVVWISSFKDIFSTTLSLAAILCLLQAQFNKATIFYVLALLAKPSVVILPLVVGVIHGFLLPQPKKTLRTAGIWLGLAIPIFWITKSLQPAGSVEDLAPLWQRPLVMLDAVNFYLGRLIWPFDFAIDYGRNPSSLGLWNYLAGVIPIAVGVMIYRLKRNYITAGALIFLIGLLPVLGLLPFRFQKFSTVSDHYLYFPLIGVSLVAGFLFSKARKSSQRWGYIGGLVLFGLCFSQVKLWSTTPGVFLHTLRVNPKSYLSHNNLGVYYYLTNNFEEAAHHFSKTAAFLPKESDVFGNWGASLMGLGKPDEAFKVFKQAFEIAPDSPTAQLNLARGHLALGNRGESRQLLDKLLRKYPNHPLALSLRQQAGS